MIMWISLRLRREGVGFEVGKLGSQSDRQIGDHLAAEVNVALERRTATPAMGPRVRGVGRHLVRQVCRGGVGYVMSVSREIFTVKT